MQIDYKAVENELREIAGDRLKVKVVLNKKLVSSPICETPQPITCRVFETDGKYIVQLNPIKIRCPARLEEVLKFCRSRIGGIA